MKAFKQIIRIMAASSLAFWPLLTMAQSGNVLMESKVSVANVTAGQTEFQKSVNAKTDEVVKIQLWYHNTEKADSGRIAKNVRAKIQLPTNKGLTHTVRSTISSDNSNTVKDDTTVVSSNSNAALEYIPGSAKWRHNDGTNSQVHYVTQSISDEIVNGGIILENAKPCFNFEATVTILARVKTPGVSITKQVRVKGQTQWVTENTARPGDTLEYLITFKNEGNSQLRNVVVGDNPPTRMTLVPGTTKLRNGANPNSIAISSNNITSGGIDVGHYNPGAVGYVTFEMKINDNLEAGNYVLRNNGIVRPEGMNEFFNTATTRISVVRSQAVVPPPVPTPTPPPTQTPQTGPELALMAASGSGVMGLALHAHRRSRRSLIERIAQKG